MKNKKLNVEEIDIEDRSSTELNTFFKNKNVIHIEGGNTFYLLRAIKQTGFDKIIKNLIAQNVVYIGTSAGAYITCPTIEMSTWSTKQKDRYGVTDLQALNLVPFLIKAHYTDDMKKSLEDKISGCKYPVRILRDGQGLLVKDDSVSFVGIGEEVVL